MDRKFVVLAVSTSKPDELHGLTVEAGWMSLNAAPLHKLKAQSSSDACASRDAAQTNTLNGRQQVGWGGVWEEDSLFKTESEAAKAGTALVAKEMRSVLNGAHDKIDRIIESLSRTA